MLKTKIDIMEVTSSLASIIDLVSPHLQNHHIRVAYIAKKIGEIAGAEAKVIENIVLSSLLHDCGALSLKEKLRMLQFDSRLDNGHAEIGYRLLKSLKNFSKIAETIRYHHVWWIDSKPGCTLHEVVPEASYIINLADRVDVLINRRLEILGQVEGICAKIKSESGVLFKPQLVQTFLELSERDEFWKGIDNVAAGELRDYSLNEWLVDTSEAIKITRVFEQIIDFRSRFTATHSRGVAVVAEELAKYMNMDESEIFRIRVAGSLHDIGKLGVPIDLIEKADRLTDQEYSMVKHHALLTYEVLKKVKCLEAVYRYAAFHHELLDGTGYPFGLCGDELSVGARIVAIADMFTAMTEDRPYRRGMDSEKALKILCSMAGKGKVDYTIVDVLKKNLQHIQKTQYDEQNLAREEYERALSYCEF